MTKNWFLAGVAAAVLLALMISCGDDKPTGPGTATDYAVYFWDGAHTNWYYEYWPEANQIDSFYIPIISRRGIKVSADGKRLYLAGTDAVDVVDLNTRELTMELPYQGGLIVSPDNRRIAIVGENIDILRTSDYSVVYHDTTNTGSGTFSTDGRHLYCISQAGGRDIWAVRKIDVYQGRVEEERIFTDGWLDQLAPSLDETKWFIYFFMGQCFSAFAVYDVHSDSLIYFVPLWPGLGELAVAPDGRTVYYTNPGPIFDIGCCRAPSAIYAYDIASNTSREISTLGVVPPPLDRWLPMGELAITPDNKYLVSAHYGGFEYLITLDISRERFIKYVDIGQPRLIYSLTCQNSVQGHKGGIR